MPARPADLAMEMSPEAAAAIVNVQNAAKKQPLTPEIIEAMKEAMVAHGLPPKIYKFEIDKDVFVFRPLFRADWNEINGFIQANQGNVKQEDVDRRVCERGILWPEHVMMPMIWDFQRAGVQSTLAKHILGRSGFFDPDLDQRDYLKIEPIANVERGPKPSPEVVVELKGRFPTFALKGVYIDGEYYVVRSLSRAEWKMLSTDSDDVDLDLTTAERATIWSTDFPNPPNFGARLAGTVRALSEVIMQASGFLVQPVIEEL